MVDFANPEWLRGLAFGACLHLVYKTSSISNHHLLFFPDSHPFKDIHPEWKIQGINWPTYDTNVGWEDFSMISIQWHFSSPIDPKLVVNLSQYFPTILLRASSKVTSTAAMNSQHGRKNSTRNIVISFPRRGAVDMNLYSVPWTICSDVPFTSLNSKQTASTYSASLRHSTSKSKI